MTAQGQEGRLTGVSHMVGGKGEGRRSSGVRGGTNRGSPLCLWSPCERPVEHEQPSPVEHEQPSPDSPVYPPTSTFPKMHTDYRETKMTGSQPLCGAIHAGVLRALLPESLVFNTPGATESRWLNPCAREENCSQTLVTQSQALGR